MIALIRSASHLTTRTILQATTSSMPFQEWLVCSLVSHLFSPKEMSWQWMVYRRYTPGQVPLAHPGHHETKAPTPSRTVRKIEIQGSSIPGGRHCQLQTASLTNRNLCVSFLFEGILWQSTIAMENYGVFVPSSVGKWANHLQTADFPWRS